MIYEDVFIVVAIFFFCYKGLEILVHKKERLNLIEKLGSIDLTKEPNINYSKLFGDGGNNKSWAIRIGSLIIGLGIGILVAYLIISLCHLYDYNVEENMRMAREQIRVIYGASTLLFGGLGLIVSYIVENKLNKK
jgi:hypothetical protein